MDCVSTQCIFLRIPGIYVHWHRVQSILHIMSSSTCNEIGEQISTSASCGSVGWTILNILNVMEADRLRASLLQLPGHENPLDPQHTCTMGAYFFLLKIKFSPTLVFQVLEFLAFQEFPHMTSHTPPMSKWKEFKSSRPICLMGLVSLALFVPRPILIFFQFVFAYLYLVNQFIS